MKLLLDIKDDKVSFFLELLKNFPFVKAETVSSEKTPSTKKIDSTKRILDPTKDLADSFNDVKLHIQGKKKLKSAKELLNEL